MAFVALTVPASIVLVTLKFDTPVRFVIFAVVALIVFVLIVPLAVKFWIFARLVMVFCVPLFKVALIVPPTMLPVTVILSNVPLPPFTLVALTVPI
ncbi:hypothetical protein D3C87_1854240 [compost metagenome]